MSRHLHALPSHVLNVRPQHPTTTRLVFLTDLEASVAVAALRASTSQAVRDVADVIYDQWRGDNQGDVCDPHGIPRPGAS